MIPTTMPVVVAIADKQPSALRFAAHEACSRRAPLRVVHSTNVPLRVAELFAGEVATLPEELHAAGQALIDAAREVLEAFDVDVVVDYVLTPHTPIDALMEEAGGAALLVVGADDVRWFERLMRTKVAGYLAQHAPCPVVVVPEQEFPTGPDGEVIVALDGATAAIGAVRLAFEEATARDCLLHVLHATPVGTLRTDEEAARARVAEELAGWRETYPDVPVLEGFTNDDPEAALVRATRSADLVVLGRPDETGLPLALVRPLAMRVLRAAQCPVAVVPADYRGV
jgi:nucleotide-binding universal stress UspA family protein